jgi:outer membrane protein OmpA-like peptidoglycan-associated protein
MMRFVASALLLALGGQANADNWLVAETPAAMALSDAQEGAFRPGLMPAVGAYADNGRFALGARLRLGMLRNGPAPGGNQEDPGFGGLGTAGIALRALLPGGGWVEGVAGGGLTGSDLVPAVEAGAGWSFETARFDIGPSVRFVRVMSQDNMDTFGNADLLLVGVDVVFGRERKHVPVRRHYPAPRPVAEPAPVAKLELDRDAIVEHEPSCAQVLDGCPLSQDIKIEHDRIILDERVLFDFDRARVRSGGKELIATIAKMWSAHPEWTRLTIEGHACAIGTDEYNQDLSERRAANVRAALLAHGFSQDRVDSIGFGRSQPRAPGVHEKNRRVEFVIERSSEVGGAQ